MSVKNPLGVKEGDLYKSGLNGKVYSVSKIEKSGARAVLDSVGGEGRIVTEIDLLKTPSFYRHLDAE